MMEECLVCGGLECVCDNEEIIIEETYEDGEFDEDEQESDDYSEFESIDLRGAPVGNPEE
jgi:hypothetical protein|tara:strand:- start:22 stop:201 length:180 start_codon:yes stop_codon:yes gene_type:complete